MCFADAGRGLLALALLWVAGPPIARAAGNDLQVRARTSLDIQLGDRDDGAMRLGGLLRDDQGRALSGETVLLRVGSCPAWSVRTDDDGRYELWLRPAELNACFAGGASAGPASVVAEYVGGRRFGSARSRHDTDIRRFHPQLLVVVRPARARAGEQSVEIFVRAQHRGRPAMGRVVRVQIDDHPAQELLTDADGAALWALRPNDLPPPGEHVVEALLVGDARFNPVRVRRPLIVSVRPELTLRVVRSETGLRGAGALRTAQGPLGGRLITLLADDLPVLPAVTGPDGHFALDIAPGGLPDGDVGRPVSLRARSTPDALWEEPAQSSAIAVVPPAPARLPVLAYVIPLATLLALFAIVRYGRRTLLWVGRRRARRQADPAAPLTSLPLLQAHVGLGAPLAEKRVRRTVAGTVFDAHARAPLGLAQVGLYAPDAGPPVAQFTTLANGRFSLGPLSDGDYVLRVSGPAHEMLVLRVAVPHRGEFERIDVQVMPHRARLAALWVRVLRMLGLAGAAWGRATPGESLPTLAKRLPEHAETLASLAAAVERGYFDLPAAAGPTLERALSLVGELQVAAAPAPPAPARRPTAGPVVALLLAALLSARSAAGAPLDDDYALESDAWNGLSALMQTAAEAQVRLSPTTQVDWRKVTAEDVLWLLFPERPLPIKDLRRFIEDGGRLVVADDFGQSEALLRAVGLERVSAPPDHPLHLGGANAWPVFELGPASEHFLFFNTDAIVANHPTAVRTVAEPAASQPIVPFGDPESDSALVLERTVDAGRLLVVADASLFINDMLRRARGNKQFAANLLRYYCVTDWCDIQLVLPGARHSGRYVPSMRNVRDVHDFFAASIAAIDAAFANLDQHLATPLGRTLVLGGVLLVFAALARGALRRPRGRAFAWQPESLPTRSAAADQVSAMLRARQQADFRSPLSWLQARLDRWYPHGADVPGLAAARGALARVAGQRRVSPQDFMQLYDRIDALRPADAGAGQPPAAGKAP